MLLECDIVPSNTPLIISFFQPLQFVSLRTAMQLYALFVYACWHTPVFIRVCSPYSLSQSSITGAGNLPMFGLSRH